MWPPRTSTLSLPKIVPKMTSSSTGKKTVKPTAAGLRQKAFWSKRNWWPTRARPFIRRSPRGAIDSFRSLRSRGEVEVDVLERGAGDCEAVEVLAALQCLGGEAVELPHRVEGLD